MTAAYVDASALVKLLVPERESAALRARLAGEARVVTSVLAGVELRCVLRMRRLEVDHADLLLRSVRLLDAGPDVLRRAGGPFEPPQRALDAIHLATAETHRSIVGTFLTYDERQAAAARALGIAVDSPGA